MLLDISLILFLSASIGFLSYLMAPIAEKIEEVYNWPSSVKGAVIDAISSSFPEFATALTAVIFFNNVDVGINTIVGSALFNLLLIPGICSLFMKTKIASLDPKGFQRDSLFYFLIILLLALAIYYFEGITLIISILFLLCYGVYLWLISRHVIDHRSNLESFKKEAKILKVNKTVLWSKIILITLSIGGVCHVLVERSLSFGEKASLSPAFIGFFVLAAATSVPDMMMSIISTKRGKYDASISNVFASNIFDICICIFLPILIFFVSNSKSKLEVGHSSLHSLYVLIVCSALVFFVFGFKKPKFSKPRGAILMVMYAASLIMVYRL